MVVFIVSLIVSFTVLLVALVAVMGLDLLELGAPAKLLELDKLEVVPQHRSLSCWFR